MSNNLVNFLFKDETGNFARPAEDAEEFIEYGEDILESESLTDSAYTFFTDMIAKSWSATNDTIIANKKEVSVSDIGLIYKIGPYLSCVKRVAFSRNIDIAADGMPKIRVTADISGKNTYAALIRPVKRLPNEIQILGRCPNKYKYVTIYPSSTNPGEMDVAAFWFGIKEDGRIMSSYNKRSNLPQVLHGASQAYPSLTANMWADAKYLWGAKVTEDIGMSVPLTLRMGLSKEHIKSLFYARKLPVTETGRKRPILHWVRSHTRRLKEGIDINIEPYLRGVTRLSMDGLNFEIIQPNKKELHHTEPDSVNQAFKMYG